MIRPPIAQPAPVGRLIGYARVSTDDQSLDMQRDALLRAGVHPDNMHEDKVRAAAKAYCDVQEAEMPDGPDKTFVIRNHRSNAMWANVAITRQPDGSPRA